MWMAETAIAVFWTLHLAGHIVNLYPCVCWTFYVTSYTLLLQESTVQAVRCGMTSGCGENGLRRGYGGIRMERMEIVSCQNAHLTMACNLAMCDEMR